MQTNGEEPTAKRQRTGETQYEELLTLDNPPTGFLSIYNKSGVMYVRDDTGVESQLGAGGAASEPPQYGELAGTSTVACTVQNTFYQVSGLTTGLTSGFSVVGSTLVYTGTATAPFKVACSFSMETDTKNNTYEVSAFVNGVQDPQSTATRYISNNDVGSASFAGLFTLSPGDVVDVEAQCSSGAGTTLTFTAVNLTIIGIGGGAGGTGDVSGPGGATDNAIARYDTTTGKLIQSSIVTITDTGDLVWNAPANPTLTCGGSSFFTLDAEQINLTPQVDVSGGGGVRVNSGMIVNTTTGALRLPNLTTVQRDAIAMPSTGDTIYNTTTKAEEIYNGTTWIPTTVITTAIPVLWGNLSGQAIFYSTTEATVQAPDVNLVGAVEISPTLASPNSYTLPSARGTDGQVMQTNASGVVTWQTPSGGGSTAPTQGALIRDTPYDTVASGEAVTFEFTVGDQPVGIGTLSSDLFSCTTGNVTITDVTGVPVDTDLLNRVFTIEAQFYTDGTQTLSFDNTATTKIRNALGDAFLSCTADVDVTVSTPPPTSTALFSVAMSTNTTPSPWRVAASTEDASSAFEAFNRTAVDLNDVWISNANYDFDGGNVHLGGQGLDSYTGEWLCITDTASDTYRPLEYTLAPRNFNNVTSIVRPPTDWVVLGTTDTVNAPDLVTTWDLIDSEAGVTFDPINVGQTFTINSPGNYPRFAFVFQKLMPDTAGTGNNKCGIGSITFDGDPL